MLFKISMCIFAQHIPYLCFNFSAIYSKPAKIQRSFFIASSHRSFICRTQDFPYSVSSSPAREREVKQVSIPSRHMLYFAVIGYCRLSVNPAMHKNACKRSACSGSFSKFSHRYAYSAGWKFAITPQYPLPPFLIDSNSV